MELPIVAHADVAEERDRSQPVGEARLDRVDDARRLGRLVDLLDLLLDRLVDGLPLLDLAPQMLDLVLGVAELPLGCAQLLLEYPQPLLDRHLGLRYR